MTNKKQTEAGTSEKQMDYSNLSMDELIAKLKAVELENQAYKERAEIEHAQGNVGLPATTIEPMLGSFAQQLLPTKQEATPAEFETVNRKMEALEEKWKEISGSTALDVLNDIEESLVPGLVIPKKFQTPDFEKYDGRGCPKKHLRMYCRKMANYLDNEKLMIHVFQESLTSGPANWYMELDRSRARNWSDMKVMFINQYRHNIDYAPDRTALQMLEKRKDEAFRSYAARWRDLASQVQPPLTDKEFIQLFINTLKVLYMTN